jgi:hypothetical protein
VSGRSLVLILVVAGAAASAAVPATAVATPAHGAEVATPAAHGAAAAAAPRVDVMVVGRSRVLAQPRAVRATATTVRAGRRRCAVAAATPLSALAALRRAGGPSFTLRDFGSCSSRPADAGGLFVRKLGTDANHGQDGWVYKVGSKVGTTSAGDPSGPLGDGRRVRTGQGVLWFWCHMGSNGCQRTLAFVHPPATVVAGGPVTVTVDGYDDMGRGRPAANVTVALGSVTATTGADGRVTLPAPAAPGSARLTATGGGAVAAFPEAVRVT